LKELLRQELVCGLENSVSLLKICRPAINMNLIFEVSFDSRETAHDIVIPIPRRPFNPIMGKDCRIKGELKE